MEMPNVPKVPVTKTDETNKVKGADRVRAEAYGKVAAGSDEDRLNLSAKAKLMQTLRTSYDKLPDTNREAVETVKQKIADEGSVALSSEELVASILQGTLFEAL